MVGAQMVPFFPGISQSMPDDTSKKNAGPK